MRIGATKRYRKINSNENGNVEYQHYKNDLSSCACVRMYVCMCVCVCKGHDDKRCDNDSQQRLSELATELCRRLYE